MAPRYRPVGLDDGLDDDTSASAADDATAGRPGADLPGTDSPGAGSPGAGDHGRGDDGRGDDGRGDAATRADAGPEPVALPRLGPLGTLRWVWRQLTSMRVALLLLMLLAVVAVPGSVLPQRPQDPAAVETYLVDNPSLGPWLDRLGFFDVYASVWFSAVYLLLFLSLIGCIVPRTLAHAQGVRARPPRAPRRFDRFAVRGTVEVTAAPEDVVAAAAGALRGRGPLPRFRVDLATEPDGARTVAAERGYLRESGNLLFHLALVGLLVSVAAGQLLHFRAQELVVEGDGFANAVVAYDTFEAGAAFDAATLEPFSLVLDRFTAQFTSDAQARSFQADVTLVEPGQDPRPASIRVNRPLSAGGAKVYLQGNGYAPDVVVRDASGEVAFAGAVPFLPEDPVYTSRGVIKVVDVLEGPQIGLAGYLLPSAQVVGADARSVHPQPAAPLLVLNVWTGDLGLDDGVPQNVYQLETAGLEQVLDAEGAPAVVLVEPGQTVELPDGLGSITWEGLPRFAALDLRHDPALPWIGTFAALALVGLGVSLFTPRRRLWVRVRPEGARTVVAAAALARGDDMGLPAELERVVDAVRALDGRTTWDGADGSR